VPVMPMTEGGTSVRDERWAPVLGGIRTEALDCLQTTFALLADDAHGSGAHLALGSRLAPTVAPSLEQRVDEAGDLLGLRVIDRWTGLDGPTLRDLARRSAPLYVVADAHDLCWGPYAGREHMDHSFLLVDDQLVIDAYQNDTPWGDARPGVWRLSAADLDAAAASGAVALATAAGPSPTIDAQASLAATSRALRQALPDIERYVEALRSEPVDLPALDRLVLDVWVLARTRSLHTAWLASLPGLETPAGDWREQSERWRRLSAQTYLAARRARRHLEAPGHALDELDRLLHEDVELAGRSAVWAGAPAAGAGDVQGVVLDELRNALGADCAIGGPSRPLRDLPGFNSFRLLEVIERIEGRLGIRLDADHLTAESLRDVGSLCGLFAGAVGHGEGEG
jgi:Phosphopantetheine attachment site